jgi:hypothetical protein
MSPSHAQSLGLAGAHRLARDDRGLAAPDDSQRAWEPTTAIQTAAGDSALLGSCTGSGPWTGVRLFVKYRWAASSTSGWKPAATSRRKTL